jgi:hypothetical protein
MSLSRALSPTRIVLGQSLYGEVRDLAVVAIDETRHGIQVALDALRRCRRSRNAKRRDPDLDADLPACCTPALAAHLLANLTPSKLQMLTLTFALGAIPSRTEQLRCIDEQHQTSPE